MLYIVITTPHCNLRCSYCGGDLPDMPDTIQYDMKQLITLIRKDSYPIVAFYGGEPLLEDSMIKKLLHILPAKRFVIQTNGYFLKRLKDDVHMFDSILLSIDGREKVTDTYREFGCYHRVMEARDFLRESGYSGEVIARMTASKNTDIYEDVTHLLKHFPFVHWQLDAIWSTMWNLKEFQDWIVHSYKPGLDRLIEFWVKNAQQHKIYGIIPFLGIMSRMLNDGYNLPCEAGYNSISITTDGTVLACPIAVDFEWNVLGDLMRFNSVQIGEPCKSCDTYKICGGRCLFSYKEQLWGTNGFSTLCNVTKYLIKALERYAPLFNTFESKIHYPPYNNTTEIIP